jgi:hypothetical protein
LPVPRHASCRSYLFFEFVRERFRAAMPRLKRAVAEVIIRKAQQQQQP